MTSSRSTFAGALNAFLASKLGEIRLCLPAKVEAFDAVECSVTIQPLIKEAFTAETGERVAENLPTISGVPVLFPTAGGKGLSFPVSKGDTGLAVFSHASLSAWLTAGGLVDPGYDAKFSLSDALFLPGLRPFSDALPSVGSVVRVGDHSGSFQGVALGANLESYAQSLDIWLNAVATFLGGFGFVGGVPPSPPALKSGSAEVSE